MIRFVIIGMIAAAVLAGCTAKEFNQGVDEGVDDIKRVIRGTNN